MYTNELTLRLYTRTFHAIDFVSVRRHICKEPRPPRDVFLAMLQLLKPLSGIRNSLG